MSWGFAIAVGVVSALAMAAVSMIRAGSSSGSPLLLAAGCVVALTAVAGIVVLGRATALSERPERRR